MMFTVFTLLGHVVFGFEQSWLQPIVALASGYAMELLLETIDARTHRRRPRYRGGLDTGGCILITHLGTALLCVYIAGTQVWLAAGLPDNIYLV